MPIVDMDLSQIEWRVACFLGQDKVGIDEIKHDVDFHSDNANRYLVKYIAGSTVKEMRNPAKTIGFGLIFGKTPAGFAADPSFPINDKKICTEIVADFYTKYAGIRDLHERWIAEVKKNGYIVQPTGRIIRFKREKSYDGTMQYNERKIKNYGVQSLAGADIMPLALVVINRRLRAMNHPAKFIIQVHDSAIYDCPWEAVDDLVRVGLGVFNELPELIERYFGFEFNVPLTGEAKVGPTWGTCEEYHLAR